MIFIIKRPLSRPLFNSQPKLYYLFVSRYPTPLINKSSMTFKSSIENSEEVLGRIKGRYHSTQSHPFLRHEAKIIKGMIELG